MAGGTETLAIPLPDGTFRLHGYKWFSSATDSDVAFTLARITAEDGSAAQVLPFLLGGNACFFFLGS